MSKLKMDETLTQEAFETLTPAERRQILKVEQAKECSGLRKCPTTCSRVIERIPAEYWEKYSAERIGEIMALLKKAYDDRKAGA